MKTRRNFLKTSAGVVGVNAIQLEAEPFAQTRESGAAPSDRVRFGIIGIGMQGTNLLGASIALPGVECVGAADLYDGRHTHAREITNNPNLPVSRNYLDL